MQQSLKKRKIQKIYPKNHVERSNRFKHDQQKLPITSYKDKILASVRSNKTTIIVGETGSGKSTQIPQFLVELFKNDKRKVICTQPRRVAAVTIAQRVAFERDSNVGDEVGYAIRFQDVSSTATRIKFVTDGVLLRECMTDKMLSNYHTVILDEAHERSLQTDILMGLLRELQEKRNDLRIVVMSATLQIDLFSDFFQNANVVTIPGRQFPVDLFYTKKPEPDYLDAAMLTCLQIHEENEDLSDKTRGVLVFLPGQEDIENLITLLTENLPTIRRNQPSKSSLSLSLAPQNSDFSENEKNREIGKEVDGFFVDFEIRPLYAAMSSEAQLEVFKPSRQGVRVFVLATNIAETSVTLSGIKYVVDTGFVKTRLLNSTTGIEMLKVMPVSQSQAQQRAGRAGRECPGVCYRLYTEDTFTQLPLASTPEIQRIGFSQVLLQLKALGVKSPTKFPFLSPPSTTALRKAFELLLLLGALDRNQELTEHGKKMAFLPLNPLFSHLLLVSLQQQKTKQLCSDVLTTVALLSSDVIFLQPTIEAQKKVAAQAHRRFAIQEGDLPTLLNIYDSWVKAKKDHKWASRNFLSQRSLNHAAAVREQLQTLLQKLDNSEKVDLLNSKSLEIETTDSSVEDSMNDEIKRKELFLRCLASGLMLNLAKKVDFEQNKTQKMSKLEQQRVKLLQMQEQSRGMITNKQNDKFPGDSVNPRDEDPAPYRTLRGGQPVYLHPSSVLFSRFQVKNRKMLPHEGLPQFVVYSELLVTSKQYMRNVTAIDPSFLSSMDA